MSITDIRPAELVEQRDGYTVAAWLVVTDGAGRVIGMANRPELVDQVIEQSGREAA
jgi:hypothetical protein